MKNSKRLFFYKGPISSLEYIFRFSPIGIMFEYGRHEGDEVGFQVDFLFGTIYVKLNMHVNTWVKGLGDQSKSFGFRITNRSIKLGLGTPGEHMEGQTIKKIRLWSWIPDIFIDGKLSKEFGERKEFSIFITDLNDNTKSNEHKYKYRIENWTRKYPHKTSKKKYTSVECITNPPLHPGKGTTSYNCDDDGTYAFNMNGEKTLSEIKGEIARSVYYYRQYYPV